MAAGSVAGCWWVIVRSLLFFVFLFVCFGLLRVVCFVVCCVWWLLVAVSCLLFLGDSLSDFVLLRDEFYSVTVRYFDFVFTPLRCLSFVFFWELLETPWELCGAFGGFLGVPWGLLRGSWVLLRSSWRFLGELLWLLGAPWEAISYMLVLQFFGNNNKRSNTSRKI